MRNSYFIILLSSFARRFPASVLSAFDTALFMASISPFFIAVFISAEFSISFTFSPSGDDAAFLSSSSFYESFFPDEELKKLSRL